MKHEASITEQLRYLIRNLRLDYLAFLTKLYDDHPREIIRNVREVNNGHRNNSGRSGALESVSFVF